MDLAIGRIVHIKNGNDECRPAIIVKVWDAEKVNAVAFRDGSNDHGDGWGPLDTGDLTVWRTSVEPGTERNQYHDPRGCANKVGLPGQ